MGVGRGVRHAVDAVDPHQRLPAAVSGPRRSPSGPASRAAAPPSARSPPACCSSTSGGARCSSSTCRSSPVALVAGVCARAQVQGLARRRRSTRVGALLSIVGLERAGVRHHRGTQPRLGQRRVAAVVRWRRDRARAVRACGSGATAIRCSTCGCSRTAASPCRRAGSRSSFFAMFGTFFLLDPVPAGRPRTTRPLEAAVRLLPFSVVMMAVAPQTRRSSSPASAPTGSAIGRAAARSPPASRDRAVPDRHRLSATGRLITMCVLAGGMALTMTPMTTQLMAAGAARPGRDGFGDERHHPRARRRARCRRARLAASPASTRRASRRPPPSCRPRPARSPRAASAASSG